MSIMAASTGLRTLLGTMVMMIMMLVMIVLPSFGCFPRGLGRGSGGSISPADADVDAHHAIVQTVVHDSFAMSVDLTLNTFA
jgi:hypothetical protein